MCRGILPRHDQDGVEAQVLNVGLRIIREPDFRRGCDAPLRARRDRLRGVVERGARFHFDEDQRLAAAGDDVDLAERAFQAPRQNAIALGDELCGGAALG